MGILDFFRKKPEDRAVVFTGDRVEAELVANMLEQEGFHPSEWADMSGPFAGPVGMSRVSVPTEEGERARDFLLSLEEAGDEMDKEKGWEEERQEGQPEEGGQSPDSD